MKYDQYIISAFSGLLGICMTMLPQLTASLMRPVTGRPHDTCSQLTSTYLFLNIKWNKCRLCHLITCLCPLYTVSSSEEPSLSGTPLGNEALPATAMNMYLTTHTSISGRTIIMCLLFLLCFWVQKQQNQMHTHRLTEIVFPSAYKCQCLYLFL